MAPVRRPKDPKPPGWNTANLDLDPSLLPPQAARVRQQGRQRYQPQDESSTDNNFYTRRRVQRAVGPRGPQPAAASSTWASRASPPHFRSSTFQGRKRPAPASPTLVEQGSAPKFRLSMFQGRDQGADRKSSRAGPGYGPLNDVFEEAEAGGFGWPPQPQPQRQRDEPQAFAYQTQAQIEQEWALLAAERSRHIERQILGFLSGGPSTTAPAPPARPSSPAPPLPQKFLQKILREAERGGMRPAVRDYYLGLRRHDVRGIPGHDGTPSLVGEILARDADERLSGREGEGWRPVRTLGKGGQGKVILWEKAGKGGETIRLATKDMGMTSLWFQDYNSEGHLTRRLNQAGCPNVIKVLEWAYLEPAPMPLHDMSLTTLPEEPKFRIAYEVADHGDLHRVVKWYEEHNLIFPEAFMWHIFSCLTTALCYCALGQTDYPSRAPGWEEIVHGDLKPENVLLADPTEPGGLYPTAKLADFGLAYTVGNDAVRRYKAAFSYGTRGYMAPELAALYAYKRNRWTSRPAHVPPGPHTDIYSLGRTMDDLLHPTQGHYPLSTLHKVFAPVPTMPAPPTPPDSAHSPYIYSYDLLYWMNRCMADEPSQRPGIFELHVAVAAKAEEWRAAAEREARGFARAGAGAAHSRVLWRREEREAFERDDGVRARYRERNLGPLWERLREGMRWEEGEREVLAGAAAVPLPSEEGLSGAELFYEAVTAERASVGRADEEGDAFWRLL